jgi:hypothetical protein
MASNKDIPPPLPSLDVMESLVSNMYLFLASVKVQDLNIIMARTMNFISRFCAKIAWKFVQNQN